MSLDQIAAPAFATAEITDRRRRTATRVVVAMLVVALSAVAFGRAPGVVNPGVLAALIGAVIVTELLSACLLFSQFLENRALWLAAVGAGYLFAGFCIVGYLLTFPHVFSERGFFNANEETALCLWCAWHAGFPAAIVVAALLKSRRAQAPTAKDATTILVCLVAACTLAAAALVYAFSARAWTLPILLGPGGFTPVMVGRVLPLICMPGVLALLLLVRRRPTTSLEIWLPIAVLATVLDAVMGVMAQRYSIVWYVGKFFAVTSSSIMVTVFLSEIAGVSKALARANRSLRELSEHIAKHDAVTDLPNRTLLIEHLRDTLSRNDGRVQTAILHVNLDRFRTINEAIGASSADELLREMARRVAAAARKGDVVACTGGGDFIALLPAVDTENEVVAVANAVIGSLREPYLVGGRRIFPSASVGIAIAPGDASDAEALLDAAASAMHLAKRNGGNQLRFYRASLHVAAVERLEMEADLRAALRRGEFRVYYQPIVNLSTRHIASAEALLRWEHRHRGLLVPDAFIPAAEQNGMIVPIGAWVLDSVTRQIRSWHERGADVPVAVNVSVREFQDPAFYDRVAAAICRHGIDPNLLTIEITESLAIDDSEQTRQTFVRCRELGVNISLDDFGTGHACLANVKRLPLTTLKIDKSFVVDLATSPTDAAIVTAILSFAKSLRLTTVAEGVESIEQLQWLRTAGCAYAQGYHFARPLTCDAFETRLWADLRDGRTASASA